LSHPASPNMYNFNVSVKNTLNLKQTNNQTNWGRKRISFS
jgi:hypothetical protein